jgi:hypothetical protein
VALAIPARLSAILFGALLLVVAAQLGRPGRRPSTHGGPVT